MTRRPHLVALALAASALACAPAPRTPTSATPERPGPAETIAPSPTSPAAPASAPEPVVLEPELQQLLTAHREPQPQPLASGDEPLDPRASSRRRCEEACARTLDREAFARRLRDRDAADRWLAAREPVTLHYPYVEIDGLRITYDGEGRPLRCSHSIVRVAGSYAAIDCASGQDLEDMSDRSGDH
ncbi:MAG: hypothetical protein R3B09_32730 [Nannocystaceae bacterium]